MNIEMIGDLLKDMRTELREQNKLLFQIYEAIMVAGTKAEAIEEAKNYGRSR